MVAVLSSKPTKLNLSYQDVALAFQDGNWTRLCEEGSEGVHWLLGVKGKASLSLTYMDDKVTLTFSTNLWHLSAPLQSPQALAPKLRLQLLNLQLQDLNILDLQLLARRPATGPPAPGSQAHGPPAQLNGTTDRERDLLRANLN